MTHTQGQRERERERPLFGEEIRFHWAESQGKEGESCLFFFLGWLMSGLEDGGERFVGGCLVGVEVDVGEVLVGLIDRMIVLIVTMFVFFVTERKMQFGKRNGTIVCLQFQLYSLSVGWTSNVEKDAMSSLFESLIDSDTRFVQSREEKNVSRLRFIGVIATLQQTKFHCLTGNRGETTKGNEDKAEDEDRKHC